jgi:hypothetical protein
LFGCLIIERYQERDMPGFSGGGGILVPEALKLDCPDDTIGGGGPPGTVPENDGTEFGALRLGGPDGAIGGGGPG